MAVFPAEPYFTCVANPFTQSVILKRSDEDR